MKPEEVLQEMLKNKHFSKTLKRCYTSLYEEICSLYPGKCPKEHIWNFCHQNMTIPACEICKKQVKFSNKFISGYNRFCSARCAQDSPVTKGKQKQTLFENFGVSHNFKSRKIKEARQKTWLKKYGVDNPAKAEQVQNRITKTIELRYGKEWRAGAFSRNMQSRYGVENSMHLQPFQAKVSAKRSNKPYITPSGKSIWTQGFEWKALNILFSTYAEDDIKVHSDVPAIWYLQDKRRIHFPDIFVQSKNLIIEVKSGYTFRAMLSKNIAKMQAAIEAGFNYAFWIFEKSETPKIIASLAQLDEVVTTLQMNTPGYATS